mgnify:FL=1|tara:strand:+ start:776 stop:952 length:177 start_codon:yes stop_codon:yes gene_type:complete
MEPSNPNDKCGNYTINYNTDDLVEMYTNKLVLKLVKEKYPELYKKARKTIKALVKSKP